MKPTSVICLILALVLIAAGSVTCIAAQRMAENNGIDLFYQNIDAENNGIEEYGLSADTVSKLTISLDDCDVHIHGGADVSRVRLTNFAKNTYEYIVSNKNLTINDHPGLMSLFNITSGDFNFNGLRYYINSDRFEDKERSVDIYLKNTDEIKMFDISIKNGNLTLDKIGNEADYKITIGEGSCNVTLRKAVSIFKADIGTGNIDMNLTSYAGSYDIAVGTGRAFITLRDKGTRAYDISASGGISYFGDAKGSLFSITPLEPNSTMKISVENGSAFIEKPVEAAPDVQTPETSAETEAN